jgi:hypothetical protein
MSIHRNPNVSGHFWHSLSISLRQETAESWEAAKAFSQREHGLPIGEV